MLGSRFQAMDTRSRYFLPAKLTMPSNTTKMTEIAPTWAMVPACQSSHITIANKLLFGEYSRIAKDTSLMMWRKYRETRIRTQGPERRQHTPEGL